MGYIGRGLSTGQYRKLDSIASSFDGDTTEFELTVDNTTITPSSQNCLISINGVVQEPFSAFAVTGSAINFSEAPDTGANFFGIIMGEAAFIAGNTVGQNELASKTVIANYIGSAISGSLGDNADLLRSTSLQSVLSASFMDKAGAMVSASFVTNAQSGSFASGSDFTALIAATGSFASGSDVYALMQATGSLVGRAVASASFMAKDGAAISSSFVTNAQSGSFASGSDVYALMQATGSLVGRAVASASFISKDGAAVSGTFATRASVSSSLTSGNESVQFNQITGSTALVSGRLTVNEVFTQYVSSSVLIESSGSTKLGNEGTDLHQVTGSMSVLSGSLITRGTAAAQEKISGSAYSTGSFGHVSVAGVLKTGDIELENKRGHWRIVEESEYLSIYNVNTNKKYKILMEEIE